jgi:hypothetical protein
MDIGKSSVIFDSAISSRIDKDGFSDTSYPGLFKTNKNEENDGDTMVCIYVYMYYIHLYFDIHEHFINYNL